MKTEILYNNINPFDVTPYISKQDEIIRFHNRWGVKTVINLQGIITGDCSLSFNDLINKQNNLINNFSQDFKNLIIKEENEIIYSGGYCTVEKIGFDQSKYVRALNYDITLNCYQENLFSGIYGIKEPISTISYQEGEDSIITAIRTISARGFNTNGSDNFNNAFSNAKDWVQSKTGWNPSNFSLPYFITYNNNLISPCLKEQTETIDRFNAFYEITEKYTWNKFGSSSTIIKYNVESNYVEEKGIYEVNIQGSIEGCPEDDIQNLRSIYKGLDLYSIANYEFHKAFPNSPNLNPEFLLDEINENTPKRIIDFRRSYDTDLRSPVMFDYEITVEYDVIRDIHSISLNGVIRSKNSQKVKWGRVLDFYENLNIFNFVQDFYINNGYPYSLVSYPISYQVTENEFAGEINISVSYNNRKQPEPGFDNFSYTINIQPSINQFLPIPVICGDYTLLNLNALRRAKISVNGEAFNLSDIDKSETLRIIAKSILNQYIESPSENRVIKTDKTSEKKEPNGKSYNFEYSENYLGPEFNI